MLASKCFADRTTEAIREFQTIIDNRDVTLPCALALIHAYKKTPSQDKDAVQQLEARLT